MNSSTLFSVCSFYHLVNLFDNHGDKENAFIHFKNDLKEFCNINYIKGTVIIAKDGINGTFSGSRESMGKVLDYLAQKLEVKNLFEYKFSECDFVPFNKMKIFIKEEVVSMRSDISLNLNLKPEDASSEDWDHLLEKNNLQLLDARNSYEYEIGTFANAINPNIKNFREFKDYLKTAVKENKLDLNKKTAIFCTGGIRCEKAGIYMRNIGFKNVYQLKSGILKYFEETKNKKKQWIGDCFVFDDRITVRDDLVAGDLRCMHCFDLIKTVEEKRSVTKGRVICNSCKYKKIDSISNQNLKQEIMVN